MILDHLQRLILLLSEGSSDRSTLDELLHMVQVSGRRDWRKCHDLFQRIRQKTLKVERGKDKILEAQYFFEESCAKTLYNLSGEPAPFDAHSPYWIIPNALIAARLRGIESQKVVDIVAG